MATSHDSRPLRRVAQAVFFLSVMGLASAGAQPAPPPAPPIVPSPDPPDPETPPVIPLEVDDPLLALPPSAPHELRDWKQTLDMVSARSTNLIIAVQEVERARGAWRQALGQALPVLTARGDVVHHLLRNEVGSFDFDTNTFVTETVPDSPVVTGSVTASVPILAVREWYAIGTEDRNIEAAELRADDARRLVLAEVTNAALAVVTTEQLNDVNRAGLRSALERLELERRRAAHGAGSRLRLLRFEQDVARARTAVITGDEATRRSREALGLALGQSEPWGVSQSISFVEVMKLLQSACHGGSIDERSDVAAAQAEVEVAERRVTEALLLTVPTADAFTTFTASTSELQNRDNIAWTIGASLVIPLYDGGVRYGLMHSAEAVREESRAELDRTRREAQVEVTRSGRDSLVAEQQRELAEQRRDLAREASRLTAIAFEQGAATSFELVETAGDERQAELELVLREFDVLQARVAALLATATCSY
jgi:outer membrane protein, multidrug efflux system